MDKNKLSDVYKLKETIGKMGDEKEVVPVEKAVEAEAIVKTMAIENAQDMFLYYSALNLLNTFVKQDKKYKKNYNFKKYANFGIESMLSHEPIDGVTFNIDKKEGAMLINVGGMQFSFHSVESSNAINMAMMIKHGTYKPEEWEGLRLQKAALTVFDWASNLENLSNKSMAGDLDKYRKEQVENYLANLEGSQMQ